MYMKGSNTLMLGRLHFREVNFIGKLHFREFNLRKVIMFYGRYILGKLHVRESKL